MLEQQPKKGAKRCAPNSLFYREPMTRFELVTSSLPRKRSTPELHRHKKRERETGFEPATFSLEGWRSTNWATPAGSFVGRAGFEPAKVKTNRFTVCPRWPLEYLPKFEKKKSRWRDSNPRPADYKSAALASWATSAFFSKKKTVKTVCKVNIIFSGFKTII